MNVFPSVMLDQPLMLPRVVQLVHVALSNEHCGFVVSVSVIEIVVAPLTLAEVVGEVIETIGAIVSTITWIVEDVVVLPAESVALVTNV